jgi:predicted AlkP superfamily pyrophosphatase or phosphodiesterase
VQRYAGESWRLLQERDAYLFAGEDDQPWEVDLPTFGRTFPHAFGEDRYLPLLVSLSPMGDAVTLDFAKTLIENEKLGRGQDTDLLAVSFSATDYSGHLFGPGSLESEDTILRLDRVLADLFAFVDAKIGLENTLIVLSADHGGVEAPEQAQAIGISAGRMPLDFFRKPNAVSRALEQRFGAAGLILGPSHPYLYLDTAAIAAAGLDLAEVERFVAEQATRLPGIDQAFTRSDLLASKVSPGPVGERVLRSFHPDRSGSVHLVQPPYWFMHSTEEAEKMGLPSIASIHGSPWAYDTHVPIFFAGHGVPPQRIARRVGPNEIAATLSNYLGVKPPSASSESVLFEVIPRR